MRKKQRVVYQIVCLPTGQSYIGASENYRSRKMSHLYQLRQNKHHNILLQNAFNTHGEESFKFEIIELVEPDKGVFSREGYYQRKLDTDFNIQYSNPNLDGFDTARLIRAIKANGYSVKGFSEKVLGISYRTFKTQLDKQTLRVRDIKRILELLDKQFDDIF